MFVLVDKDGVVYARGTREHCVSQYGHTLRMAACYGVHGLKLAVKEVI